MKNLIILLLLGSFQVKAHLPCPDILLEKADSLTFQPPIDLYDLSTWEYLFVSNGRDSVTFRREGSSHYFRVLHQTRNNILFPVDHPFLNNQFFTVFDLSNLKCRVHRRRVIEWQDVKALRNDTVTKVAWRVKEYGPGVGKYFQIQRYENGWQTVGKVSAQQYQFVDQYSEPTLYRIKYFSKKWDYIGFSPIVDSGFE